MSRILLIAFVEAVIKVDDGLRPEPGLQLLPRHQRAGFLQQHREQLKRLFLQRQEFALLGQFPRTKVGFEDAEPKAPGLMHDEHV